MSLWFKGEGGGTTMFFGVAFRCQSALTAVEASEWKPEPHANVIGVKPRSCQSSGNVRCTLNNHTRYVWPIDSDRKYRPFPNLDAVSFLPH